MTAKEALEYFKRRKEQTELNDRVQQAEDLAIEALEKQIPKRAISTYKENYKCPTCENYIEITDDDLYVYEIEPPEYCPNCGQALDWGEKE